MNKYTGPLRDFWMRLISLGQSKDMSDQELKYVKFTNVIALLTAAATFFYIPFSLLQGNYTLGILQEVDAMCVLVVLYLNYRGYPKLARHAYILVVNFFVLINSCFIGFQSGVHDFFYIAYIVPFLLFSVKDYKDIIFGVMVSIILFNVYQFIYPHFTQYNLDANTQHTISNINLWMKFVLFGVAIYILSYYNYSTEAELELSNQKLQEQAVELKRSNDDLEQFAAIISHDLKAPVSNVNSFMGILIESYGDILPSEALNFIELSKNSTGRMGRQIDDLLSYSKLGRDLPAAGNVDVNIIIETIQIELGEKIKSKNASIIATKSLPMIGNVHSSMIHHIFQNLIANGVKFNTSPRPEVRIDYSESDAQFTFYVKDNGIGINAAYKNKLFSMFKRLHTEAEFEGTGIGLAVCKKIVDFYGGHIWLESEMGNGTCFYFTLPKSGGDISLKQHTNNKEPEVSSYDDGRMNGIACV